MRSIIKLWSNLGPLLWELSWLTRQRVVQRTPPVGVAERTPPVFVSTPYEGFAYASGGCLSVLFCFKQELFKRTLARALGRAPWSSIPWRPALPRAPSLRPGLRATAAGPGLSLAGKVFEFRVTLCYRRQGTFGVASTHSPAELLWRTRQRVAQAYPPAGLFERTPPV